MAKEINIESIISDRQLDKILDFIGENIKKGYDLKERNEKRKFFIELNPEEAKKVEKEMERIFKLIEDTDPKEHEYYTLVSNYKALMGIFDKNLVY